VTTKKPKPKTKKSDVPDTALSAGQRIKLTRENFELLKKFVTGEFPETFGLPYERLKVTPEACPACRFRGGFDYAGPCIHGRAHAGFDKEFFRQNRVVDVFCLACGFRYKVTESWLIHFEVEQEANLS
jgi:hypothetical protein